MQNRQNFLPFFLVFFSLSLILILFGTTGIYDSLASIFNKSIEPGKNAVNILTLKNIQNEHIKRLNEENLRLKKTILDQKEILAENAALKNQFENSPNQSSILIPAKVIGSPGFLPGISDPRNLIINLGENQGVRKGDAVLSNNYLVGKITQVYPDLSKVELISNSNSTLVAKVESEGAPSGILKGHGGSELVLENIASTDVLKKDLEVLTLGEKNERNEGYPPDIQIGKIISIEKKQSDLFQKAVVLSPIDFKNLTIVFVLKSN